MCVRFRIRFRAIERATVGKRQKVRPRVRVGSSQLLPLLVLVQALALALAPTVALALTVAVAGASFQLHNYSRRRWPQFLPFDDAKRKRASEVTEVPRTSRGEPPDKDPNRKAHGPAFTLDARCSLLAADGCLSLLAGPLAASPNRAH